jgi:hypothetical protein
MTFFLSRKNNAMAKYSKKAQNLVERAMKKRKSGTLKSGSGRKVTNPKQAIAIGLSEARKKGAKVPAKKKTSAVRPAAKRKSTKRTASRKKAARS